MQHSSWMSFSTLALIVTTIFTLALGQVLFKFAASAFQPGSLSGYLSLPLFSALVIYAVATIMWLLVLSRTPLTAAFPFYGLGFIFVPLLSRLVLGEQLRASTIVGGVIILVGVVVSSREW